MNAKNSWTYRIILLRIINRWNLDKQNYFYFLLIIKLSYLIKKKILLIINSSTKYWQNNIVHWYQELPEHLDALT